MIGRLVMLLCGCKHRWEADASTWHWVCRWCPKRWSIYKGLPPGYRP